jgi:hypothetical protein
MLELLGYRVAKHVTDSAVTSGCGARRWDGYTMHDDWHLECAVAAIRSAAQVPCESAVADALAEAVAKQEARERMVAKKRKHEETEAAHRREEEAVVSGLQVELRVLRSTDPGMEALRIGPPDPVSWGKTTPVVWQSLRQSPRISPYLSAAQRPNGFRFKWRDETVTSA